MDDKLAIRQNFVTFVSPGYMFAEKSSMQIDTWNVNKAIQMSYRITESYGAKPYAFYFTMRGRREDELNSREIARSGVYYIRARIETLEQMKIRNDPGDEILINNMGYNHWDRVVRGESPYAWAEPLEDGDTVLAIASMEFRSVEC